MNKFGRAVNEDLEIVTSLLHDLGDKVGPTGVTKMWIIERGQNAVFKPKKINSYI